MSVTTAHQQDHKVCLHFPLSELEVSPEVDLKLTGPACPSVFSGCLNYGTYCVYPQRVCCHGSKTQTKLVCAVFFRFFSLVITPSTPVSYCYSLKQQLRCCCNLHRLIVTFTTNIKLIRNHVSSWLSSRCAAPPLYLRKTP